MVFYLTLYRLNLSFYIDIVYMLFAYGDWNLHMTLRLLMVFQFIRVEFKNSSGLIIIFKLNSMSDNSNLFTTTNTVSPTNGGFFSNYPNKSKFTVSIDS